MNNTDSLIQDILEEEPSITPTPEVEYPQSSDDLDRIIQDILEEMKIRSSL